MSDHIADTNKMVDTPRMNSVAGHARGIVDAAIFAEGMKLELELNAANQRIKLLEEFVDQLTNPKFTRDDLPKEALLQRIKRLEEAGNRLKDRYILENENWDLQTVNDWNDAKEAKL